MTTLTIDSVSKAYGSVDVLDTVSLQFESGSIHALVGPNGSGKTTLFRIILGLTRPGSGSVSVPESDVGCGFQEPRFYPDLTVDENLHVFGSMAGAADDWLARLRTACGLGSHRDRLGADLSDGLAKKLDFALAFVDQPRVALLDEPFADIDDASKTTLLEFLASYRSEDRLVLITTHQLSEFAPLVDTVRIMVDGSVVYSARVAEAEIDREDLTTIYRDQVRAGTDSAAPTE